MQEHQAKIERLIGMERAEVQRKHVAALVDGLKCGELTVADVTAYTNITPEKLAELMMT